MPTSHLSMPTSHLSIDNCKSMCCIPWMFTLSCTDRLESYTNHHRGSKKEVWKQKWTIKEVSWKHNSCFLSLKGGCYFSFLVYSWAVPGCITVLINTSYKLCDENLLKMKQIRHLFIHFSASSIVILCYSASNHNHNLWQSFDIYFQWQKKKEDWIWLGHIIFPTKVNQFHVHCETFKTIITEKKLGCTEVIV